jgi:hypothetical protein
VGCAVYVVIENAGSLNLVLSLGALLGACLIFMVQLLFELQESTTAEDFPIEFTTDYETKSIRSRQPHPAYRKMQPAHFCQRRLPLLIPMKSQDGLLDLR